MAVVCLVGLQDLDCKAFGLWCIARNTAFIRSSPGWHKRTPKKCMPCSSWPPGIGGFVPRCSAAAPELFGN